MSSEKRSTLDTLGLPKEFGLLLLSFALILALSPYIGGSDLGIFKVPQLSPRGITALRYLGPVLLGLISLLFLPWWCAKTHQSTATDKSVDQNSKYRLQSIADIVRVESATHGIHIDGLRIGDRFHINDLIRICTSIWSPEKSAAVIRQTLEEARAKAFSRKYAEPREDEKLADVSRIKIDGLKPWETYLTDVLADLGVEDVNQLDILCVGLGNGHAEDSFLRQIHSFRAVDISDDALQYARNKYSRMISFVASAEDLKPIPKNSVDLYLSLRTYQSTLFDRRAAVHEAYRVLRSGGMIVLSVPVMFLRKDGQVLQGLIPPGSSEPNMDYARQIVRRIGEYLSILNFRSVATDERSPFEIFISARR